MATYYPDSDLSKYSIVDLSLKALETAPTSYAGKGFGSTSGFIDQQTGKMHTHAVAKQNYTSDVGVNTLDAYHIMNFIGQVVGGYAHYHDKMLQAPGEQIFPFMVGYEQDPLHRGELVERRNIPDGKYDINVITFSSAHEHAAFTEFTREAAKLIRNFREEMVSGTAFTKTEMEDGKLKLEFSYGNGASLKDELCQRAINAIGASHLLKFAGVKCSDLQTDHSGVKTLVVDKAQFEQVMNVEAAMIQRGQGK